MKRLVLCALINALFSGAALATQSADDSAAPPHYTLGERSAGIRAIAVAQKGKTALLFTTWGQIEAWNWRREKDLWARGLFMLAGEGLVADAAVNPKGDLVAVAHTGLSAILFYETTKGKGLNAARPNPDGAPTGVAWARKGKTVFAVNTAGELWKLAVPMKKNSNTGEGESVQQSSEALSSVAVGLKGKVVATGGTDGTIRLNKTSNLEPLSEFVAHAEGILKLVFHPDGKQLVSCGARGRVKLWTLSDSKLAAEWDAVDAVAFALSPKGRRVATASSTGRITIWESETGAKLASFTADRGAFNSLLFLGSGDRLLSGGLESGAIVWNLKKL